MGISRQEFWSGLPCPPPGDLLTQALGRLVPHLADPLLKVQVQWQKTDTLKLHEALTNVSSGLQLPHMCSPSGEGPIPMQRVATLLETYICKSD